MHTLSAGNFYLGASSEACRPVLELGGACGGGGLCIGVSRQAPALIDNLIKLVSLEGAGFCMWRKAPVCRQAINSQLAPQAQVGLEWDRRGRSIKTTLQQTQVTPPPPSTSRAESTAVTLYSRVCLGPGTHRLGAEVTNECKWKWNSESVCIEGEIIKAQFAFLFPLTWKFELRRLTHLIQHPPCHCIPVSVRCIQCPLSTLLPTATYKGTAAFAFSFLDPRPRVTTDVEFSLQINGGVFFKEVQPAVESAPKCARPHVHSKKDFPVKILTSSSSAGSMQNKTGS